jgi:UDP-N-acetylglucosamine transferase subunit ALG13
LPGALVILSVGTDHHPFRRVVDWVAEWAKDHSEHKVIIQRGTAPHPVGVESHELIAHDKLRELFGSATAVVSHGGPSTVMDARMAGKLPIVVARDPEWGEHVDAHQMRFAEHLNRYELARLVLTKEELFAALADALDHPEAFEIPLQDSEASSGVVQFGKVVDDLLGIKTRLQLRGFE